MKIGFFGVTSEQQAFYKNALQGHEVEFIQENLDEDHIPNETDFEVISAFVKSKISEPVLNKFPNLKLVVLRSTGFDNVDLQCSKDKGIAVCNVPAYGSHTVAEFTFGLILSLSRKIPDAVNRLEQEKKFSFENLRGFDLFSKTVGVVGTGKIGVNVIKIAKGFGMQILAFDVHQNEGYATEFGFEYVSFEDLLKNSDIVTLHAPATPETNHMISQQNISLMKPSAFLINTARGSLVETEALVTALENKQISGAGLDVLEDETQLTPIEEKLVKMDNVISTPHMAFYTAEAEQAIMQTTVDNILGFISQKLQNVVNK